MAFTAIGFQKSAISNSSADTVYTVSGGVTFVLRFFTLANRTAVDATCDVWIDIDGTGATDAELYLSDFSVPANDVRTHSCWIPMAAASTIKAQASAANTINIVGGGANYS